MPLAYLINIVESTLVYIVVIYHIFPYNKCICQIYNDVINYCCYKKCQHACVRVYAIVAVARAVVVIGIYHNGYNWNNWVVIGIFGFLDDNIVVLLY